MSRKYTSTTRSWRARYRPLVIRLEDRTVPSFIAASAYIGGGAWGTVDDFNGDDVPDIALVGDDLKILLGKGDGSLAHPVSYETGKDPHGVTGGDFNGDGIVDLATANFGGLSAHVSILLGNGDGTFQRHRDYPTGRSSIAIATADFNEDGALDLAVPDYGVLGDGKTVDVLLGNGDGTFGKPTPYAVGGGPRSVAVGDFDADGYVDLAVTNGGPGTVSILLGRGAGDFKPAVNFSVGAKPYGVAVGYFNEDTVPDLAVANDNSDNISVLIGKGDGTFNPKQNYPAGDAPRGVTVADLDGDGDADLGVAASSDGKVNVLRGNGDGTFQAFTSHVITGSPPTVVSADFDGDGDIDLASIGSIVSVLSNYGDGTLPTPLQFGVGSIPNSVASGDFNGDGHMDIAAVESVPGKLHVLLGSGDGTLGPSKTYFAGDNARSATVADFNGDDRADIALVNPVGDSSTVSVFLGNGDGTFALRLTSPSGTSSNSLAAEDLNDDGRLDVAVTNNTQSPGKVSVLLGGGDGTFLPPVGYAVGKFPTKVAISDVNADHFPDLIVANTIRMSVSVLLNKGHGAFSPRVDYRLGFSGSDVAAGDFNGDGHEDLAAVAGNVAGVLLNHGNGTFAKVVKYSADVVNASTLALADFDRDGRVDLGVAGVYGSFAVLRGKGNGSFSAPVAYASGSHVIDVVATDLDGDHYPDVVVDSSLTVLINAADWGAPPITAATAPGPDTGGLALDFDLPQSAVFRLARDHRAKENLSPTMPTATTVLRFRIGNALFKGFRRESQCCGKEGSLNLAYLTSPWDS